MLVRGQSLDLGQKVLSLFSITIKTILFKNLVAQLFMKWSGMFTKLEKVSLDNVKQNHLFGHLWQLFLRNFVMYCIERVFRNRIVFPFFFFFFDKETSSKNTR